MIQHGSCKYGAECGLLAGCVCQCCCEAHACECFDFNDDDRRLPETDASVAAAERQIQEEVYGPMVWPASHTEVC